MRHYITQYGFWWSASPTAWKALVEHALANDGDYDLNQFPGIKALRGRPSTIRVEDDPRRAYYYDIAGHPVHRPLDWTESDWRDAND